jgi:hypothetical protein
MSSEPTDETTDTTGITDPTEYVTERRLRDIFDARTKLRDRRLAARTAVKSQEFRAVSAYRSAVSNYVMEIDPLMRRFDAGTEPLFEQEFGIVTIGPDVRYQEFHSGADEWMLTTTDGDEIPIEDPPEPVDFPFLGLDSLFVFDDPLTATWEVKPTRRGGTTTHRQTGQIPFGILDDMAMAANRFLGQIGLELDPEPDRDDVAEFDYSDLI